jgi:diguanylate cyclase (GGDEF)-like protein/PAS domain S-box-containing protein
MPVSVEAANAGVDLVVLERRLKRERDARKAAEQLLGSKSLELYEALEHSAHAQRLLELALWASGESIWEWSSGQDEVLVRSFPDTDGSAVVSRGSLGSYVEHVHPDDLSGAKLQWRLLLSEGAQELDIAVRYAAGQGGERWMRVRGKVVEFDADKAPTRAVGTVKDITAHREAEQSFRLMASAFASSRDAMVVLTEDHRIVEANGAFQGLMRDGVRDPVGLQLSEYLQLPGPMATSLGDTGFGLCESDFRFRDDATTPVEVSLSRVAGANGRTSYLIATIRDITERKRAEIALERMARHDALTELPNRSTLQQRLALQLAAVDPHPLAVLFLDLDGFKEVNDSLGHEAGDDVLKEMAARLQDKLSPDDMLARWGGDEFVMVLHLRDGAARANRMAQHLLAALRERVEVRGHEISVTGSIGIAIAPHDGLDSETLLRHADAAMYAAKNAGKNRMALYHPGLTADALRNVILITQLRTAIEQEQLHFLLQPKFDTQLGIVGAELLARWDNPQHGPISPVVFIPLAEDNGMSLPLGRLAIDRAARCAAALAHSGRPIPVAVNISALQVMDTRLDAVLRQALKTHGISPAQLELEVTESIFLQDSDMPERRIEALRAQGFPIAMDDFGTGYSSLGYLRRLPFDTIKIDRSFLIDVDQDDKSQRLLAGVVNLCTSLGIGTVAEGVETEAQFNLLRRLGVDQFQGFFLARPMPLEGLLALLQVKPAA